MMTTTFTTSAPDTNGSGDGLVRRGYDATAQLALAHAGKYVLQKQKRSLTRLC